MLLFVFLPGLQLVWQQENPLQEKHWQVPRGGQPLRHEDSFGGQTGRRFPAHSQLHRYQKTTKAAVWNYSSWDSKIYCWFRSFLPRVVPVSEPVSHMAELSTWTQCVTRGWGNIKCLALSGIEKAHSKQRQFAVTTLMPILVCVFELVCCTAIFTFSFSFLTALMFFSSLPALWLLASLFLPQPSLLLTWISRRANVWIILWQLGQ